VAGGATVVSGVAVAGGATAVSGVAVAGGATVVNGVAVAGGATVVSGVAVAGGATVVNGVAVADGAGNAAAVPWVGVSRVGVETPVVGKAIGVVSGVNVSEGSNRVAVLVGGTITGGADAGAVAL
jgi:hypothetical protein